ncbi:MAG TPA: polysaccharide lyase 11 [Phycisphaerae bacterium]|nr:polysaccharide lyase 11 [Phycisphaerae bacterium]
MNAAGDGRMKLDTVQTWSLGSPAINFHAAPVQLGSGGVDAIAVTYANSLGSNPWIEMFSYPTDTLKLAVLDLRGEVLWRRDLGPGVVPDGNFCPLFPFDLDGDGVDELYFVNNLDAVHPFAISKYRLERVDPRTGRTTGQWPWPGRNSEGPMVNAFRNVIAGGYVRGEPVLVTAQGTYLDMYLQGWNPDMGRRWEVEIPADSAGARGSHRHPVVDLNQDGVDELMWGERCLELDAGRELFCADRETYRGHSDIIQPVWDEQASQWRLFTGREKKNRVAPRVACYDAQGRRLWGALDHGHIHIGWVARLEAGKSRTAMVIRIGSQEQTPRGRVVSGPEVFAFDVLTGEPRELPFDPFQTLPVDLNGDGVHELVRGSAHNGFGNGDVLDGRGKVLGSVGGPVAMACKVLDRPGEQVLTYSPDGTIRLWADANAADAPEALRRYDHPFYRLNRRSTACGNHFSVLGGL